MKQTVSHHETLTAHSGKAIVRITAICYTAIMPKIEVNEKLFFQLLGKKYDYDTLEKKLTCAKAELDEKPDESQPAEKRVLKIELNDTNRPDLWSTLGVVRQLKLHDGAPQADYSAFLATKSKTLDAGERIVSVDAELKDVRPYMVAFVISGKPIDEPMLLDIIQTQEKLCWNFGRKRKTISMGVYRSAQIQWPVQYCAVDPDETSFVPLACTEPMTCRQILSEHPKGKDYGWILEGKKKFPLLRDAKNEVLSMAPIINSATLGAVQVGDSDLLVELTGSEMDALILSANIVACDFYEAGYKILPVKVQHPYETGFGRDIVVPFYYQSPTKATLSAINKKLGSALTEKQVLDALYRMGNTVESQKDGSDIAFTLNPPPYRNDFLHEVDVIEDVMIGVGLEKFEPETPHDFTIGRLSLVTQFSRKAKTIMVGLGYQEMIFNYLGSKRDYIERMNVSSDNVIEIANPMSENYQFVRPSIIASLLRAESGSAKAVYPHKIFEIGKIAYICPQENTGTRTTQSLGFLTAANDANFNSAASEVSALLYFIDHTYTVKESSDPRFIAGRQAAVLIEGEQVGIFGEVHPQVLENWTISVPCVAGELDLERVMQLESGIAPQEKAAATAKTDFDEIVHFNKYIDLRVAKIVSVERNPQGEKLYIEHLDDGSGKERIIQSGLVPYLREEELIGQHVIIVANLAPRKMRGVESRGMLLAADYTEDGKEKVELLTAPWAAPGTPVIPQGANADEKPEKIDFDKFEKIALKVADYKMQLAGVALTAAGRAITTARAKDSAVE